MPVTSKAQNKSVYFSSRNSRKTAELFCALALRNARRVCLMEAVSVEEDPAPFCEGLAGKFRWSTLHSLYYILDISFKEDDSRIRKKNAPKNIAILRHMAWNLVQKSKEKRDSIKQIRKAAGWDESFLRRIFSQLLFI